tara:strand:+ start:61 stop:1083 length:1023 start_codon:yes stop_codon:yes gene_type:complete
MRMNRLYYVVLFSFVISFGQSQDNPDIVSRVATSAANWLKIETGTKAIGMGGAYTAMPGGLSGIPYNPSSVTFVNGQEGFFSTTNYFADISHSVFGYASNMSGVDFSAVHVFFLDSGAMDVTTEDFPEGTGETFHFTGLCLRGTYGRIITNRLRIGFTGKYIRENIYTTYMESFAIDIGSHFDTGLWGFKLGMSISNLGPEVKFQGEGLEFTCDGETPSNVCKKVTESFILPMTFRLGLSNEIMGPKSAFIKNDKHVLTLAFDAINPIDYTLYSTFGMEYCLRDMFYLRMGTHFSHDTADISLGAGLEFDIQEYRFAMDYAFVSYGILDYTHQFGLNFEF